MTASPSRRQAISRRVGLGTVCLVMLCLILPLDVDRTWQQGTVRDGWRLVFTGFGGADVNGDGQHAVVTIGPQAPDGATDTHACLVVSDRSYRDLVATVRVRTERQLRAGGGRPWEVAWVLWHYRSPQHFYAVTLKPTGWEISKQDPAYRGNQHFLASGDRPRFPVGRWHTVRIAQLGAEITVGADGAELIRLSDPDPAAYSAGALGLYSEDAQVQFSGFQVAELINN